MLSPDQREERQRIEALRIGLTRALERRADAGREALERLQTRLERGAPDFPALRLLLDDLLRRAADAGAGAVSLRLAALSGLHGRLTALSPDATLGTITTAATFTPWSAPSRTPPIPTPIPARKPNRTYRFEIFDGSPLK